MNLKSCVILFLIVFMAGIACNSNKKVTSSMDSTSAKANLIDGNWEVNYIMNTPKPFAELYVMNRPTINFNSITEKIMGMTGCNNFNGSFLLQGNKISIKEPLAVTRKMCLDMSGETLFLETLKKINTYSVTENGKTLNMMMGDMAIMRLSRK